jgi:NAD+ diphosphatase
LKTGRLFVRISKKNVFSLIFRIKTGVFAKTAGQKKMLISEPFRYCPACAAAALRAGSAKSVVCAACGFEYFFNPAGAVAGLIVNDRGELLVTRRAADPGRGLSDLPGGFVDPGESAEEALVREIKEELNLEVTSLRYMASAPNTYRYKTVTYATVDLAFLCRVADLSVLAAGDDVRSAHFVAGDALDPAQFAFDSIRAFVDQFIRDTG